MRLPARDTRSTREFMIVKTFGGVFLWVGLMLGTTSILLAQAPANPGDAPGTEILTRGPVHEAFGEPVVFDPKASIVIAKEPPQPIEEQPPDERPEGRDVQWIPGYWSWDDERNDFLWISGLWRDVPPGRQWVPGYWSRVDQGFQWTPGFWAPTEQPQLADPNAGSVDEFTYLPQPPNSLEVGPNTPQPAQGYFWTPGYWFWNANRYAWRPGYWVQAKPNWIWVPPTYYPSPGGYIFVQGYWDYPVARRGVMFAPVAFAPAVYASPAFVYTPTVVIPSSGLVANLFIRPTHRHYYFGDYYASSTIATSSFSLSLSVGRAPQYVPWFAFHQTRCGYDPIYASVAAVSVVEDPHWHTRVREVYVERVNHVDLRPPRTWAAAQQRPVIVQNNTTVIKNVTKVTNVTNINNINSNNVAIAQPLKQVVQTSNVKFERLDRGRRDEIQRNQRDVRQFREERARTEREVQRAEHVSPPARQAGARGAQNPSFANGLAPGGVNQADAVGAGPRTVKMPRSPIAAQARANRERNVENFDSKVQTTSPPRHAAEHEPPTQRRPGAAQMDRLNPEPRVGRGENSQHQPTPRIRGDHEPAQPKGGMPRNNPRQQPRVQPEARPQQPAPVPVAPLTTQPRLDPDPKPKPNLPGLRNIPNRSEPPTRPQSQPRTPPEPLPPPRNPARPEPRERLQPRPAPSSRPDGAPKGGGHPASPPPKESRGKPNQHRG